MYSKYMYYGGQKGTCVLYILWWTKTISQDKATSSSEEIKPVALSIAKLHLAEGIRYLVK